MGKVRCAKGHYYDDEKHESCPKCAQGTFSFMKKGLDLGLFDRKKTDITAKETSETIRKRCSNGHYYDGSRYSACPHCEMPHDEETTVKLDFGDASANTRDEEMTMVISHMDVDQTDTPQKDDPEKTVWQKPSEDKEETVWQDAANDDGVTVYQFRPDQNQPHRLIGDYPVGWLVCLKGIHRGQEFRLLAGRNHLGRDSGNAVALSGDDTVSRNGHASLVYEPRQRKFYAVPGDARSLAYLNGSVLLSQMEMKKNDRLELGNTVLMLIPCCDSAFGWEE